LSLNLRGDPYLLGIDEIQRRVAEAWEVGATEVCLQGGIHPSFDGDYYIDVCRAAKEAAPGIHVHGFTALEVTEGARRLGEPLADYLRRLMAVGLKTLPGTAAEILDDEIRAVICPDKVSTDQWLEVHDAAHRAGLRSNNTIMFVHVEAPMYLKGRARRGPTFGEMLLMHAVGRLTLHPWIENVQISWVKAGPDGVKAALAAGANDVGGTLMNESISRAAGAGFGQEMPPERMEAMIRAAGRIPRQRTTLYGTPD